MKSLAHKQTTTHPSSHDEDGACEGGRNGYPSDHQAALNKLHVGLSDNRDLAEETLGSETSGPVSGRTRLKKRSEASRVSGRNGDDSAGPSDGDATHYHMINALWSTACHYRPNDKQPRDRLSL